MTLKLYQFDPSPPCRAVLMVIDFLDIKVQIVEVVTLAGQHMTPEYLAKNPLHTIPLLEDGDFFLPDSHAIITYLVTTYGTKHCDQLYPSDPKIRALINQKLFLDNSVLFPRVSNIFRSIRLEKASGPTEAQVTSVEEAFGFLEKYLEKSKYLVTDKVTLADISCVATVSSVLSFVPIDGVRFPKLKEWFRRLSAEEWYKTGNLPGLAKGAAILKDLSKSN